MRIDTAIITGAGSGIGRAIALSLGNQGVNVLCISRTTNCEHTARDIVENGGAAQSLILDLVDYANVKDSILTWQESKKLGRCCIILAAAIQGPVDRDQMNSLELWDNVFRINILGNMAVFYAVMPHMVQDGFGRVIFFSGGGAAYAFPKFPAYSASKTALVRIVENLHAEFSSIGDFSVICLAPGAIPTRMLEQVKREGGIVKTECSMDEPVGFVTKFLSTETNLLSGRLIHVRDDWSKLEEVSDKDYLERYWKLRRVE